MWYINIVCACIYDFNEEFLNEKITYLLCGLQILAAGNCFEGFQDLEENKGQAAAMLLSVQRIDGQSSSWWRYAWRLWLAELLWLVLPSTGLFFVSLWESPRCEQGHSWPWRCLLPRFSSTLWTVRSHPLPPLTPCFSSVWATVAYWVWEPEKQALQVSVWTFLSGKLSQMSFFCVHRGWPSRSVRRGDERKVLQEISQVPKNEHEVCQPSWIPSHAHPWKTILPLSPICDHTHISRWLLFCCFLVKKFPLICVNVSGKMEVCLTFFFLWQCSFAIGLLVYYNHSIWWCFVMAELPLNY